MKLLLVPAMLIGTAAAAQAPQAPTSVPPAAALPAAALPAQSSWDPAAQYITAGQDEAGYRSWYLAAPARAAQVKAFNDYLAFGQVSEILPTWQLLRTATSWQACGGQPFEVPPSSDWPNIVQTLRYIRDYVIPAVGPVEAVSVYRNPLLNQCAGGAPESAHKLDSAIDMVPLRPITREALMTTLCAIHSAHGAPYKAGLGFYAFLRFHVDSTKFRRWNMDPAVAQHCPPILHPEDIASVGQPLAPASAPGAPHASSSEPQPLAAETKSPRPVSQPQHSASGTP